MRGRLKHSGFIKTFARLSDTNKRAKVSDGLRACLCSDNINQKNQPMIIPERLPAKKYIGYNTRDP